MRAERRALAYDVALAASLAAAVSVAIAAGWSEVREVRRGAVITLAEVAGSSSQWGAIAAPVARFESRATVLTFPDGVVVRRAGTELSASRATLAAKARTASLEQVRGSYGGALFEIGRVEIARGKLGARGVVAHGSLAARAVSHLSISELSADLELSGRLEEELRRIADSAGHVVPTGPGEVVLRIQEMHRERGDFVLMGVTLTFASGAILRAQRVRIPSTGAWTCEEVSLAGRGAWRSDEAMLDPETMVLAGRRFGLARLFGQAGGKPISLLELEAMR